MLKCLHTICKQSLCLCYWWQIIYIVANWFVSYVIRCNVYNWFVSFIWYHLASYSGMLFFYENCVTPKNPVGIYVLTKVMLIWTTQMLFGVVPKRRQLIARTNACVMMIQFTDAHMEHQGLFITWMTLFAAWISNYILYKVWVWYTCPFSILNVVAVGVVNG